MLTALELYRLPCQSCGTWTCTACGWKRHGANLMHPELQYCARCGSTDGSFQATRHQAPGLWDDHNPAAGPTCRVWDLTRVINPPYEPSAAPCAHPSCQVITWGHVITGER